MKYLIVLLSLLISTGAAGQETVLKGTLGFPGGESFTYELHFTEGVHGALKGYSLLYATPGNETRANLIGLINREEKTLSFTEQSIEYSRNFDSRAYICRISATLLFAPNASAGRPGLFGTTGANEYNNNRCSSGSLSFNASDVLRKLFAAAPPEPVATPALPAVAAPVATTALPAPLPAAKTPGDTTAKLAAAPSLENMPANQKPSPRKFYFSKSNKKAAARDTVPPPIDTSGGLHLTDGEAASIICSSEVLEVSVFDATGPADGDEITLMYNDRPLLNRFVLRAAPQQVRLPLGQGGKLRIIAIKEGTVKPCVAHVYIRDGEHLHRFVISNTVGKEATVLLQKEGQL